jgi:hypothetical protein
MIKILQNTSQPTNHNPRQGELGVNERIEVGIGLPGLVCTYVLTSSGQEIVPPRTKNLGTAKTKI